MLQPLFLLTAKPTMYVANVEEHGFEGNPLLDRVRDLRQAKGRRSWPRARRLKPRSPTFPTRTKACSWKTWACTSPGSTA